MTDDEMIVALECCIDALYQPIACDACPYKGVENCAVQSASDIIELINHQKEEIEKLKEQLADVRYLNTITESDGIREFAERLKTDFLDLDVKITHHNRKTVSLDEYIRQSEWLLHDVAIHEIDNLVEEMTEDK